MVKYKRYTAGITIVELMIAITLLGIIFLTSASIDILSRRFSNVADRQAELQNELSPLLLNIKKNINMVTGDWNDPGIDIPGGNRINLRLDVDSNGDPNNTANSLYDADDDTWVTYRLVGNEIRYWPPGGGFDVMSTRVTDFTITPLPSAFGGISRGVEISITGRFDVNEPVSITNPQLTLTTSAHAIAQSAR